MDQGKQGNVKVRARAYSDARVGGAVAITRVVQVSSWDVSIVRWAQWVGVLAFVAILTIGLQWDFLLVMDVMALTILMVLIELETWWRGPIRGSVCQDA